MVSGKRAGHLVSAPGNAGVAGIQVELLKVHENQCQKHYLITVILSFKEKHHCD
jgi:hypothetical protein